MKSQVRTYIKKNYKFELYVENKLMYCEMYKEDEYVGKARCSFAHFGGKALCTFSKCENTTGFPGFAFLSEKDFNIFERFMEEQRIWQVQNDETEKIKEKIERETGLENVEVIEENTIQNEDVKDGKELVIKVNNELVKIVQVKYYNDKGVVTTVQSNNKELKVLFEDYLKDHSIVKNGLYLDI